MKKKISPRHGFILPTAIILMFVCSLAIAAVLSYVSFTTRMTAVHLGNSACRFAAQSAIESAKQIEHLKTYPSPVSFTGYFTLYSGIFSI